MTGINYVVEQVRKWIPKNLKDLISSALQPTGNGSALTGITASQISGLVQPVLMATKTGIDGAALASTDLVFEGGISLATHIPTLIVYKFASGTLGIAVAKLKNSVADLTGLTVLLTLISGQEVVASLSGVMPATGNLTTEITTASLGASTFNVYVYGIVRP